MNKFLIRTSVIAVICVLLGVGTITAAVAGGADLRSFEIPPLIHSIIDKGQEYVDFEEYHEQWKEHEPELEHWNSGHDSF